VGNRVVKSPKSDSFRSSKVSTVKKDYPPNFYFEGSYRRSKGPQGVLWCGFFLVGVLTIKNKKPKNIN
jgi:hypothetical protein